MTLCDTKSNTNYWNNIDTRPITDSSLVLWLNPNYNITTIWNDLSGNNNNASFTNTNIVSMNTSGTLGSCPEFLGSAYPSPNYSRGAIASSASLNNITSQITLEAWVYPYITPINYNPIITKSNRISMYWVANSTKPMFQFYNELNGYTTLNANTSIPLNFWSHIAMTYNSIGGINNMRIYINSVLDSQATYTNTMVNAPNQTFIGAYSTWYYNGRVSEVRIYNRELSSADINYNFTHSPTYYILNSIN